MELKNNYIYDRIMGQILMKRGLVLKRTFFNKSFLRAVTFLLTAGAMSLLGGLSAEAAELTPSLSISTGSAGGELTDGSHDSCITFSAGSSISITAADKSAISGIYIIWDSPVNEWTLTTDNGDVSCGQNGFLHEYIALDAPTATAVITVPGDGCRISDIRIFSEGGLPDDVQVWNPPCKSADIMLIPSHADDEILFFGGIIPTYAVERGLDIQVVYMTEFWTSAHIREHEKLDGLWTAGLRNYPVSGSFPDLFSEDLAGAEAQYSSDELVAFLTDAIRRFRPQVIVSHDLNGEYGHGFHCLTAKSVCQAVEAAADASLYSESADKYGAWNTPKTYLHLYSENKITLNLRQPIDMMGGKTALEIASEAYKQHVSQQWCWFYVSDEYEYSCADFGLYRTTVGTDSAGNDIFENLKSYKVQAAEEESRHAAELESISAHESELASMEAHSSEAASLELASEQQAKENAESRSNTAIIIIIIVASILFICMSCRIIYTKHKKN